MARSAGESYFAALEWELNRERAAVLGRYGERAEAAIAKCHALLEDIERGDTSAVAAYKEQRRVALMAVDDLCIQREVLRLFDNRRVHEVYRVPPPLADTDRATMQRPPSAPSPSKAEKPAVTPPMHPGLAPPLDEYRLHRSEDAGLDEGVVLVVQSAFRDTPTGSECQVLCLQGTLRVGDRISVAIDPSGQEARIQAQVTAITADDADGSLFPLHVGVISLDRHRPPTIDQGWRLASN